MATLQVTNPKDLISTISSSSLLSSKPCFSSLKPLKRSFLRTRHRFGGISCSFSSIETAKIKVVGVGGGGNNAVNRMIGGGLQVGFQLFSIGFCLKFENSVNFCGFYFLFSNFKNISFWSGFGLKFKKIGGFFPQFFGFWNLKVYLKWFFLWVLTYIFIWWLPIVTLRSWEI